MKKQKNKQPLISVIMPVYNAEAYVAEAIQSILYQIYQNFEFIIVDDASTDKSVEIIKRYQQTYPDKITLIQLQHNLNSGGDRCANEALKYAKGKYIARMDADDFAHQGRLEKQFAYLEQHPDIFLVGSNAYVIDKEGYLIGQKTEPLSSDDITEAYFTFHPLIHPTCMFRRIYKGKKFRYIIKYSANNDYFTFFRLHCKGYRYVNLPDKLLYYRIHDTNDTFSNIRKKFFNTMSIRFTMVTTFGYRPSLFQLLVTAVQYGMFLLLPEKVLIALYLYAKGIISPKSMIISQAAVLRTKLLIPSLVKA